MKPFPLRMRSLCARLFLNRTRKTRRSKKLSFDELEPRVLLTTDVIIVELGQQAALAGQPFTLNAGFIDTPDDGTGPGTFTATIDWGDGTPQTQIQLTPQQFNQNTGQGTVTANHTYLKQNGSGFSMSLSVQEANVPGDDPGVDSTGSSSSQVVVTNPPAPWGTQTAPPKLVAETNDG